ncbi:flavin-containing monooxygenase [Streptomyces sp. NPDC001351]|jgi:cyclohexanone monooxygenase|uniref:flavin-containing monooxygenase n=1 Tax=unclassified Streptomyces TaxID=2593676 RepID=UPI0036BDE13E
MTTTGNIDTITDSELQAARERYRVERDKRLRPDANDQYIEVTGEYESYVADPYVEPGFTRDPVVRDVQVLIMGAGFSGLLAAARLRDAGIDDFAIIEKAGDVGGTWYWNRYPGAQCDIESYIYLPLLEETGYLPIEKYSRAPEIRQHAIRIAQFYDLYPRLLFQTELRELRWDPTDSRWHASTDRDDRISARYVILSNGPVNRPKLPGIPGITTFTGHTFHTSRWDYAYTGGDEGGGLEGLADKRVAVIGTGATAIQCVPHLGRYAEHLYVVQRTPSAVDVRGNRPTDPEWAATLKPGWQRERMRNFNALVNPASLFLGSAPSEDLVADGWTSLLGSTMSASLEAAQSGATGDDVGVAYERADLAHMNRIRRRVDEIVDDPDTAEKLKAWYRTFCKRPTFNDDYLPTFNRPNVTLLDTEGRGVERVTEQGIVVNGVEYEVDCIIFATGFEIGTNYTRRFGFEIIGRDGATLSAHWAQGPRTLHGYYSDGFPNCFFTGLNQNAFTPNFCHILDEQVEHITSVLLEAERRGSHSVEPTADAVEGWVQEIAATQMPFTTELQTTCTPGYYNGEGATGKGKGLLEGLYGFGSDAYFEVVRTWRENGMPGLAFARRDTEVSPNAD